MSPEPSYKPPLGSSHSTRRCSCADVSAIPIPTPCSFHSAFAAMNGRPKVPGLDQSPRFREHGMIPIEVC